MAEKKEKDPTAPYLSGLWNTYEMEEYEGPDLVPVTTIASAMKQFLPKFKTTITDVVCATYILFWTLTLERLEEKKNEQEEEQEEEAEAAATATAAAAAARRKNLIRVYKFGVCGEAGLVFCSKMVPMFMLGPLAKVLNCEDLSLLRLTGGDPVSLLMMHRQAKKQSPGHLQLQHEASLAALVDEVQHSGLETSEDLTQEIEETASSKVLQNVGSLSDAIPKVKRVALSVKNVPAKEDPRLKAFRWSSVEVEVHAPSVFHLYREMGQRKLIPDVPEWLEKLRVSGKTEAQAKYE